MREIRLFLIGIVVASMLVMIGALAAAFVIQVDRFENSNPSSAENTTQVAFVSNRDEPI